jgi:ATP-binding cassette subfamily F protein uup
MVSPFRVLMTLVRLDNVSLAYGHVPLLAGVDFHIGAGERVCLVGRNGAGKSTLFRAIAGSALPDDGEIWRKETLRVAHLEQEAPPESAQTIFEVVAGGLGEAGILLTEYHQFIQRHELTGDASLRRLAELQHRIDMLDGWNIDQRVQTVLSWLGLPEDKPFVDCSGGTRRQVMLARALVSAPDLLLLDEPTNHLDIAAIAWLENYLLGHNGAVMFITHDRTFVRRVATRIAELNRGRLISFPGNFDDYLRRKDELLDIEERAAAKFDKKLAEEEAWIRRGVRARRTRNEGRVRALQAMRSEKASRLAAPGRASFTLESGILSGRLVVDVRRVSFSYSDKTIIRNLTTRILRGDRVGIIGPNGSGKSTLLKLIIGQIEPTSGEVVLGTKLQLAYFDQQRQMLDPERTVRESMTDSDYVTVSGRSRHVVGYLKDFLFPPERIDSPVKALSGGERNRLLLAKIFTRSANLMVLDEPTNDLDVDTLELLEDLLSEYEGTLLLVSHDRSFLDNVVTSTLVFEGEGRFGEYAGGYEDWERYQRPMAEIALDTAEPAERKSSSTQEAVRSTDGARKLTYKEQRELAALPGMIEALEVEQAELHRLMGEGEFYRQSSDRITAALQRLDAIKRELEERYARWQALDELSGETR